MHKDTSEVWGVDWSICLIEWQNTEMLKLSNIISIMGPKYEILFSLLFWNFEAFHGHTILSRLQEGQPGFEYLFLQVMK